MQTLGFSSKSLTVVSVDEYLGRVDKIGKIVYNQITTCSKINYKYKAATTKPNQVLYIHIYNMTILN